MNRNLTITKNNEDVINVRFYNTDIVKIDVKRRQFELRNGGFKTKVTKKMINDVLYNFSIKSQVRQINGEWIVDVNIMDNNRKDTFDFYDGIVINY